MGPLIWSSVADPDPNPDPDPHVLGLLNPDPLVRGMDPVPDPDPSITKKKIVRKTLIPAAL
jgi:hypothetical protein